MKQKILAICLLIGIIVVVGVNTIFLEKITDTLKNDIEGLQINTESALTEALKIDSAFKEKTKFIGLTVSHDDLTNIEDCFAELTGYLSVGDVKGAEVAKYRLIRHLEHLRRLVGFNIDAII